MNDPNSEDLSTAGPTQRIQTTTVSRNQTENIVRYRVIAMTGYSPDTIKCANPTVYRVIHLTRSRKYFSFNNGYFIRVLVFFLEFLIIQLKDYILNTQIYTTRSVVYSDINFFFVMSESPSIGVSCWSKTFWTILIYPKQNSNYLQAIVVFLYKL